MKRFFDLYFFAFKKYAEFEGRASRAEAAAFLIFNLIVFRILWGVITYIVKSQTENYLKIVPFVPLIIFSQIILLPSITLIARRLHDINHSGWLQLLLLPLGILNFGSFFMCDVFLILLCFVRGCTENNKYGLPSEKC